MKKYRSALWIIFIVYILTVLRLTVFRDNVNYKERQLNPTLFVDLYNVYKYAGVRVFLRLFLGNIGWFAPFGFIMPMLMKKDNPVQTIVMGMLFSLIIETLQFTFKKGVAEFDDLILNTVGTALGYFAYKFIGKPFFARFKS